MKNFPFAGSFSDCNGHAPLNNQRTLSPQNSIKSYHTLSPRNSIKSHPSLSRQNSLSSRGCSRQNSFSLSRQNSIHSHRTLSPQNSIGSGAPKDEYKPNNLTGTPDNKNPEDAEKEEDPELDEEKVGGLWPSTPKIDSWVTLTFLKI